ncbi:hypothetical protein NHH03_13170 [Stieleria sp. TO1_6]|uniref:hypothetical protein n=1 Tax=Stieleria tagensis TaxID=2956795 RepID=UPI00209B1C40|nr:hypothetical protein [Stieleria tagensis]MCO8122692.1 hypothetical protein [Stieleria tagensis]
MTDSTFLSFRLSSWMLALIVMNWGDVLGQTASSSLDVPQTQLAPINAPLGPSSPMGPPVPSAGAPSSGFSTSPLGTPTPYTPAPYTPSAGSSFDPYAGGPSAGYVPPMSPPTMAPPPTFGSPAMTSAYGTPYYGGPASQPPPLFGSSNLMGPPVVYGTSPMGTPMTMAPPSTFGGPTFGAPTGYDMQPSIYPSGAPSTLFPSGLMGPTSSFNPDFNPYRLIQRGRFRQEFQAGSDDADSLQVNTTDVALAFACPNFLFSNQPLFIAPSFSLHLWDGPNSSTGADLPGETYDAFLGFDWHSDPNQILGAEIGVSVGGYSEFGVFDSDSILVKGRGLGTFRLTPASTFKLGIIYYDRVKTKMLPAGGILWRPSPTCRADIFFPEPKLGHYVSTLGTNDVWWYIAGDYGGGSWTIDRADGRGDQVDVNDIRLTTGFEWGPTARMRAGQRTAFLEFGYVTDRELVYRYNPQDGISLDDTWMFRVGIGY